MCASTMRKNAIYACFFFFVYVELSTIELALYIVV